jgi:2-polyprenyl-6-hydroxyphenyl methylase/3-demethylubiquinone-9 3-methyltransferase
MVKPAKNTVCLWYDGDAEEAARFYAKTFPDSSVGAVHRAPGDFPSGKKGDVFDRRVYRDGHSVPRSQRRT